MAPRRVARELEKLVVAQELLPEVEEGRQLRGPAFPVKGGRRLRRRGESAHAERHVRSGARGDRAIRVECEAEELGRVCTGQRGNGALKVVEGRALGYAQEAAELALHPAPREQVSGEVGAHVRLEHTPVRGSLEPASVDARAEQAVHRVDVRPARGAPRGGEHVRRGAEVRWRELVKLGPSLRDVGAPLLQHAVEPRQHHEGLCALHAALLDVPAVPGVVGALEVALEARGRLEGDLEALLQHEGCEARMRLRGEPEAELLVRLGARELLGQGWHPVHDQVEVLETHPVAAPRALAHELQRRLGLLAAHGEALEAARPSARGELFELPRGVGARRGDQKDGLRRVRGLVLDEVMECGRRRVEVGEAKDAAGKVGERGPEALGAQGLHEEEELEVSHGLGQGPRALLLGRGRLRPRRPVLRVAVHTRLLHEAGEARREKDHVRHAVRRHPPGHAHARAHAAALDCLASEHTPLVLAKLARRERLCEVQGKGEAVSLEERPGHVLERAALEVEAERPDARLGALPYALGGREGRAEKGEETREGELVHVIEALEVHEGEKDGGAAHGHRAVDVALLVEGHLELGGLGEGLGDGGGLCLGLLEGLDEGQVLEDVARARGELVEELLLELLELHLELLLLLQELALVALELRLLVLDSQAQELALEPATRHREVNEGHERRRVWRDRGRLVARGEHEAEAVVEVDLLVPHLHHPARALAHEVASEKGHEDALHRVHLLHHERLAEAHGELEGRGEARLVGRHCLHRLAPRLEVLDQPRGRLAGRVDDEGHVDRVLDHERVVHAQRVAGQALSLPGQELALRGQEALQRKVPAAEAAPAAAAPAVEEAAPVGERGCARRLLLVGEVGDECGGHHGLVGHTLQVGAQ
mmetsp:Transcript_21789/g.58699  ORF Transcript_21789/g.58699 Transcript_21789/m.58699 type:complete len:882 (-) Transcript_21789:1846-4491(-)